MRTLKLGLTAEQRAARRHTLGGSDANILMNGDPAAIHQLWLVKTGRAEDDDLSRVLPVQMGSWTEEFNRYWYEMTTGRLVTHEGHVIRTGDRACTLDGMTTTEAGKEAVFEAKHVNQFSKIDEVAQKYMPQLHHNMFLACAHHAVLSVFVGTQTYEFIEVVADEWYTAALLDREREFWLSVTSDTPPAGLPAIPAPAPPEKWRTVDMGSSNAWASHAADWLANRAAAKKFDGAVKELKGLVEPDVGRAFGHGVEAKRSKAGAISIKETANAAE
jgi:predicted phage-related endonuclease